MEYNIGTTVITHAGKFHCDDVFSSALLKMINPDVKIIRTFDVPSDFDGIVYDIGRGEFDHHQPDALERENGIKYAAFGLLWKEFGTLFLEEEDVLRFDKRFIMDLDNEDNTGNFNQLASVVKAFNPTWDSDKSIDDAFNDAVEFAKGILEREIDNIKSIKKARCIVENALKSSKDGIVVLEEYVPWRGVLAKTKTHFVVYPSQRGGYAGQVVEIEVPDMDNPLYKKREVQYYFPEKWAGKIDSELQEISQIKTMRFCHNARFLITADTKEDVILACKKAKNN